MNGSGDLSCKDPGIMLFGMKIPLPECQIQATSQLGCQIQAKSATMNARITQQKTEVETQAHTQNSEQPKNTSDNKEQENEPKINPKPVEDDNNEGSSADQDHRNFKKPDKILHCPRCNSLETKFCYFNNYNVNQPRHFCKNCQRYWTAGGAMRNVPVGAGRRKNKHLASQFRHIVVASDRIPVNELETKDLSSGHQQLVSALEPASFGPCIDNNGTVLKFGPDVPIYKSMESMLNLRDQKRSVDGRSINYAENREEEPSACVSSVGNADANACTARDEFSEHNTSRPSQCYPVPPRVLPWNPRWNNFGSTVAIPQSPTHTCNPYYNTDPAAVMQWCPTPMVAVPTIFQQSIPLQFVPAVWAAAGSNGCLSPSSPTTSNSCCSGNGFPTLGKHTRDTIFTDEEKSDMCILVPKILRIDYPTNEASKIPVWASLGINQSESENDVSNKGEPSKGEGKDHRVFGLSTILEANPAAISRAHAFQESI